MNVPAIPVIVPLILGNDSTLLCAEDSTLLTVSNSFPHYLWSNGDTTQSAYHHPGLPYVTIRDTNGCAVNSAPFNVPHFPLMPCMFQGCTIFVMATVHSLPQCLALPIIYGVTAIPEFQ
ncbi:MAG: hypothetical protein IPO70_03425 [Bacteroidetes bacterium]|nr:hypothetical protein [Bacteroidota bacterium]